jgi:hypothetical protein
MDKLAIFCNGVCEGRRLTVTKQVLGNPAVGLCTAPGSLTFGLRPASNQDTHFVVLLQQCIAVLRCFQRDALCRRSGWVDYDAHVGLIYKLAGQVVMGAAPISRPMRQRLATTAEDSQLCVRRRVLLCRRFRIPRYSSSALTTRSPSVGQFRLGVIEIKRDILWNAAF